MNKNYLPILLLTILFQSCFYIGKERYEDIIQKPSRDWSIRDELTMIISPIVHNLYDQNSPNIKVFATPYYPSVIFALERAEQRIKHWTETEYRTNVDKLLKDAVGLYMDWDNNRLVDARGNYFRNRTQIDSMLFLITIENRSWPCNVPLQTVLSQTGSYMMVPLTRPYDWPCYIPDITNIEDKIFLVNEKHKFIKPKFVWGRRNNILTQPETFFALFYFREGDYHFLTESEKMFLVVKGFETDIKLSFPLSMMR